MPHILFLCFFNLWLTDGHKCQMDCLGLQTNKYYCVLKASITVMTKIYSMIHCDKVYFLDIFPILISSTFRLVTHTVHTSTCCFFVIFTEMKCIPINCDYSWLIHSTNQPADPDQHWLKHHPYTQQWSTAHMTNDSHYITIIVLVPCLKAFPLHQH